MFSLTSGEYPRIHESRQAQVEHHEESDDTLPNWEGIAVLNRQVLTAEDE